MKKELIRTDRNGTKYYKVTCNCGKCGGTGKIPSFYHIYGGVCFDCNGSGIQQYEEKEYTPEYKAKLEARRKARQEKKDAEARKASDELNKKFFERQGFNVEGKTYAVLGNTYEIKEQLKELGCKYDDEMGWHSANKLEGFPQLEIDVEEVYCRNVRTYGFDWRNRKYSEELRNRIQKANDEIKSLQEADKEYIAEVGEKVEVQVELKRAYCFPTQYYNTYSYIYNFEDEAGNVIVWKTSKELYDVQEGDIVKIAGKVKEHAEYKGTKQTVLTRCKITK